MKNIPTDVSFVERLKSGKTDEGNKILKDGINPSLKPPLKDVIDSNADKPLKDLSYKVRKFCILIRFYKGKAKYFFNFI